MFTHRNRTYIHPLTSLSTLPAPLNHTSEHEKQLKSLKTFFYACKAAFVLIRKNISDKSSVSLKWALSEHRLMLSSSAFTSWSTWKTQQSNFQTSSKVICSVKSSKISPGPEWCSRNMSSSLITWGMRKDCTSSSLGLSWMWLVPILSGQSHSKDKSSRTLSPSAVTTDNVLYGSCSVNQGSRRRTITLSRAPRHRFTEWETALTLFSH